MSLEQITERSLSNPSLSMGETNMILRFLKSLVRSSRMVQDDYGVYVLPNGQATGTINVQFTATLEPYSVFFIRFVNRNFNVIQPLLHSNTTTNYQNTKHSKAEILCTNGGEKARSGSLIPCNIIGYETPVLLRYTSTAPDVGDKLKVSLTGGTVFKHNGGELVAISKPKTDRLLVWAIRHRKPTEIYGKTTNSVSYGTTSFTINIWRNEAVTNPLETETVRFTWLGVTGQTIPSGAKIEAKWWDDLNNGAGAYRVSNSNCVAS